MSDLVFAQTPAQQGLYYSWNFQSKHNEPVQVFEFGQPFNQLDASNRIARWLGVETLDEDAVLEPTNPYVEPGSQQAPEVAPENLTQQPQEPPAEPPSTGETPTETPPQETP